MTEALYEQMKRAYLQWANVERPNDENISNRSVESKPHYATIYGRFREEAWYLYVKARDAYWNAKHFEDMKNAN